VLLEQLPLRGRLGAGSTADDEALEVGWVSGRSTSGWLGGLASVVQEPGDALRLGDDGEQAHASAATRASFDVHCERLLQELSPGAIARAD
jgi:hypothetical protein